MNAVEERRVVPIVGDNLIRIVDDDGSQVALNKYVIARLSREFAGQGNAPCKDLAEVEDLIRDHNRRLRNAGDSTDIYYEIYKTLKNAVITVPDFLTDFLKAGKFPLVLTTSYLRGLDKSLGFENMRIKVYDKAPTSDIRLQDITETAPTLYYLFGRLGITQHSFKVTEDDLLDYLHCWHDSETRPGKLGQYLSDKFLLVLGCDYPDWLFRFFWHSVKNFTIAPARSEMQGVVTVPAERCDSDKELIKFLSRVNTSVYQKTEDFIREFFVKYNSRAASFAPPAPDGDEPQQGGDVFISYASENYATASEIANIFRAQGATVWFDKKVLEGGEIYRPSIKSNIRHCKRFVPILSQDTAKPGRRYFKLEWNLAIEETGYRLNEPYITPVVIDDVDIYSGAIPEEFGNAHVLSYRSPDFEQQVKRVIRSFR